VADRCGRQVWADRFGRQVWQTNVSDYRLSISTHTQAMRSSFIAQCDEERKRIRKGK
jgi:hypothetical protein